MSHHVINMSSFVGWVAVLLASHVSQAAAGNGLVFYEPAAAHTVTFNERSAIIDGKPTLMMSGAVHCTLCIKH